MLRPARELWRHPRDNAEFAQQWQALAGTEQRKQLIHPSCLKGQRASRLKALEDRLRTAETDVPLIPNLRQVSAAEWFAAVASTETQKTIEVLKLAEAYEKDCKPNEWWPVRSTLAIIPSNTGHLVAADQAVFAPAGTVVPGGRQPVASWLCEDAEAKRILTEVLKVKPLDDTVWLDVLRASLREIPNYPSDAKDKGWLDFWMLFRAAPPAVSQQFAVSNRSQVRVKRKDMVWVSADEVLLPGALVTDNDASSNQKLLVDAGVHGGDTPLLAQLGACEFPAGIVQLSEFDGLEDWLCHWRDHYRRNVDGRASWSYLQPARLTLPAGWRFLFRLIGNASAKLTAQFLAVLGSGQLPPSVRFGHATVAHYPDIDVPNPLLWLLLRHGTKSLDGPTVRLAAIVDRLREQAMAKMPGWQELQPALEILKEAIPRSVASADEIRAMWQVFIKALATPECIADESLRELWTGAARDMVVPTSLPTANGELPLTQVFVTGSPNLGQRARNRGHVAVTLDAEALSLWLQNGARNLAELMKPEWTDATSPAELLVSVMPELGDVLTSSARETARCQPVAGLKLLVAGDPSPVSCLMWDNTLLLDTGQLASLARVERMQRLLAEAAAAGWLMHDMDESMRILGDAKVDELRAHVAQGSTLAERLLRAVENREEPLRQALGSLGKLEFLQGVELLRLAELVLAQLGPTTLTTLKETLKQEGLKPPSRWNTAEARAFVAGIGFPEEFAASPEGRREAEEFISGPIELPPLHDFQEEVLKGIGNLIAGGTTRRRGVVSLPTGAGKTRVTVEAAVLLALKPEGGRRSVLWIAQTDELCEQAVQAFRQVWLNLGAQNTDLRIVRLWGGNPNPAVQEPDKPIVVAASIQTLNSRMGTDGLNWLRNPSLVVADECHHAITPSYTNLLRFLDAEAPKPGHPPKDEPPILGLSATPFRTDDEESQRLARRFDSRWLPANQEDLHHRLRRQGVLAEVDTEALDSGMGLTPEEFERLSTLPEPWEGIDFENLLEAINQRLAGSKERNERLVERLKGAAERSILLFANSVMHAEEMAARLNLERISAAAVSGNTPTVARRYFLKRFQRGEIRVLCNHTVLSTGFDAPKTDMVLISRAVFSPVRYMQMVGRGLRGEKNGGKARCKIVTVLDNLGRFQDRHPYHYCQRFFATRNETPLRTD